MAQLPILEIADRWYAQLNATVNDSTTSWVLKSSGATGLPTRTILHCESEKVLVTAIAVDTPSAGLDTLTVQRGYGGTSAASHDADKYCALFFYEGFYNDLFERLARLEYWAYSRVGKQAGVIRDGATPGLRVKAQGSPSMTVDITAGSAVVAGQPTALRADTTLLFVAPVSDDRIDCVQIDQEGNIEIVAGTEDPSPSAPSVDADALKLAEIYIPTTATHIDDSDGGDGYITDARVYI